LDPEGNNIRVNMLKGINLGPVTTVGTGIFRLFHYQTYFIFLKALSLDLGTANETSSLSDRACSSFISVLVFVVEVQNEVMEGGR
jgi:hypothetical protein